MPLMTYCPGCRVPHSFLDMLYGTRVQCKSCRKYFLAGQPEKGLVDVAPPAVPIPPAAAAPPASAPMAPILLDEESPPKHAAAKPVPAPSAPAAPILLDDEPPQAPPPVPKPKPLPPPPPKPQSIERAADRPAPRPIQERDDDDATGDAAPASSMLVNIGVVIVTLAVVIIGIAVTIWLTRPTPPGKKQVEDAGGKPAPPPVQFFEQPNPKEFPADRYDRVLILVNYEGKQVAELQLNGPPPDAGAVLHKLTRVEVHEGPLFEPRYFYGQQFTLNFARNAGKAIGIGNATQGPLCSHNYSRPKSVEQPRRVGRCTVDLVHRNAVHQRVPFDMYEGFVAR